MKKFTIFLCILITFSLIGCQSKSEEPIQSEPTIATTTAPTETTVATTEPTEATVITTEAASQPQTVPPTQTPETEPAIENDSASNVDWTIVGYCVDCGAPIKDPNPNDPYHCTGCGVYTETQPPKNTSPSLEIQSCITCGEACSIWDMFEGECYNCNPYGGMDPAECDTCIICAKVQHISNLTEGMCNECYYLYNTYCEDCGVAYAFTGMEDGVCDMCEYFSTPNVFCPECGYSWFTTGVGVDGFFCPECGCNF